MPEYLKTHARDKGLYIVIAAFTDEDGTAVAPDTLKWSLRNGDGDVINSRTDVAVVAPAASEAIVLSGDDLKFSEGKVRKLILEGTYTSGTYGAGLPINESVEFHIDDLAKIV